MFFGRFEEVLLVVVVYLILKLKLGLELAQDGSCGSDEVGN